MSRIRGILAVLAIALAITGCKKDENPASNNNNNNQTSTYVGTIANATESGSISLTVSLAKGMGGVTGTLKLVSPSAATINLSGTFINNVLSVSGGNYSFAGTLANGTISGTYGGPNGGGGFTTSPSTNNSVKVYVGTYAENSPGTDHGTFNMVVSGSVLTVLAVDASDGSQSNMTGTISGSGVTVFAPGSTTTAIATGAVNGNTVSGTYNDGQSQGTWSGTVVQ